MTATLPSKTASSQRPSDTHGRCAAGPHHLADQDQSDTHHAGVGEAQNSDSGHGCSDTHSRPAAVGPTSPATNSDPTPKGAASSGTQSSTTDQRTSDAQRSSVGGALNDQQGPAIPGPVPKKAALDLADPLLALAADVLDDLERVRIANENRLRQLTRTAEDKDGEKRGFGLTLDYPDVACLAALVDALVQAEEQATKNLERRMKRHPLGSWVKQAKGVGEKQAARLLAAVGDPYWNDLHDRPRTVSELWAYCGYHVVHPDGHLRIENHTVGAVGVAPFRRKGVKANWSDDAKKRCFLVATSILKAGGPYREVYDAAREKYADAVHASECKRCGPSGKPAQPGSPLSAGHQHARGLRAISKAVLRDLWREAARLHELPIQRPTSCRHPMGERRWMGSALPGDQPPGDTQLAPAGMALKSARARRRRRRSAAPDSPEGGASS